MAVLLGIKADGAVNPHATPLVVFEEQLVEINVFADKEEVFLSPFAIGNIDVHGFAREVFGVTDTAHTFVHAGTTKSRVNPYRTKDLA